MLRFSMKRRRRNLSKRGEGKRGSFFFLKRENKRRKDGRIGGVVGLSSLWGVGEREEGVRAPRRSLRCKKKGSLQREGRDRRIGGISRNVLVTLQEKRRRKAGGTFCKGGRGHGSFA